jgi:GGDEF domain-containing protein
MLEDANIEFSEHKIGLLTNDFIPSFSYGMASFREANNDLDSLYQLADSRLRDAKRVAKRNRDALKREANAGR